MTTVTEIVRPATAARAASDLELVDRVMCADLLEAPRAAPDCPDRSSRDLTLFRRAFPRAGTAPSRRSDARP